MLAEMKLMVFIKISFDTLMEVILSDVPREANIMTRELQSSVLLRLKFQVCSNSTWEWNDSSF